MLDLRLPIGYFFIINAAVLLVYSALQPDVVQVGDKLFSLNTVWGIVMFIFGTLITALGWMDKLKEAAPGDSETK